jgi:hypothetical protein
MLDTLPLELVIKILLFCDIKSILACLQLNKALKAISQNQYFWNLMLVAHYSFTPPNKQGAKLLFIKKKFFLTNQMCL